MQKCPKNHLISEMKGGGGLKIIRLYTSEGPEWAEAVANGGSCKNNTTLQVG